MIRPSRVSAASSRPLATWPRSTVSPATNARAAHDAGNLLANCVASANASESRERTWSVGIVILAGALVAYGVAGLALYELVTFL